MSGIKVAFMAPEFLPNWGGVGTYAVVMAQNIPEDVEFHVITQGVDQLDRKSFKKDFDRLFGDLFGGKKAIDSMTKKLQRQAKPRKKNYKQKHGVAHQLRLLTIKDTAAYLGRSDYSVRTLIWDGILPVVQHGKKMWLDKEDLDEYIKSFKRIEIE